MDIQHVNTGKPAGIRETQIEQDNREAAPNKAQPRKADAATHSPYPTDDITRSTIVQMDWSSTDPDDVKNQKLIVRAVNHADKLAKALRDVKATLGTHEGKGDRRQGELIIEAYYKAQSALAAYEAAQ